MSAVATRVSALKSATNRSLMTRLIKSGRIPRLPYQHYFIEDEGLRSRIHLQNFYSALWPNIAVPVSVNVDVFDPAGVHLGRREETLPPFGSLFLEMGEVLSDLASSVREGTVAIDVAPPPDVLRELAAFPIPDPWGLLLNTPFWMAYYDIDENYMYVHSIDRFAAAYRGLPAPVSWALGKRAAAEGASWRAGRLIDLEGLKEFQVVLSNHGPAQRSPRLSLRDGPTDSALWSSELRLPPHGTQRVKVELTAVREAAKAVDAESFRLGVDPLTTLNGKPYVLMRYGSGPLSMHHG